MRVTIATACDSAVEYGGRLCIMGTFDTILAKKFPFVKRHCSLAVQIQWEKNEDGPHNIHAHFMDQDGGTTLQDMGSDFVVCIPDQNLYVTTSHIIDLQQLRFRSAGPYLVSIAVDGENEAEICIQVRSE